MESKLVDNFSKWNLFSRDTMIGYLITGIVIFFIILCGSFLFPELSHLMVYNLMLGIFGLLAIVCIFFLLKKWRKISRIMENGSIIQTEIQKIEDVTKSLGFHLGEIYISATYLDEKQKRIYSFEGYCDASASSYDNLKDDFKNIKYIDVYVNNDNYSEYVMLCKEGLEADEMQNRKVNAFIGLFCIVILIFVVYTVMNM